MAIADDIYYDPILHAIYGQTAFLAGSTYYSLADFYLWSIDEEDELSNLDSPPFWALDANVLTYKTTEDLYIQRALIQRLRGAAIETSGYTNRIRMLTFQEAGYTNVAVSDVGKPVVGGTTSDSGILLDFDNDTREWWIRVDDPTPTTGDIFDQGEAISITGGTGAGTTPAASATGEHLWTNVQTAGAVAAGFPYIYRGTVDNLGGKIQSWWGEGNSNGGGSTGANNYHIDVLIEARKAGTLINSGNIVIFNRRWGSNYAHAGASLAGGGVLPIPLATETDSQITLTLAEAQDLVDGTVASITPTFGAFTADVNDDDANENYTLQVGANNRSASEIYQALMYLAQDETATLNGVPGDAYTSANTSSFTANVKFPFGALAGGTLVYAQGGYPVSPGDANYQSTDNAGANYSPPDDVQVGIGSGLVPGDNVAAMPLVAIDGNIAKNEYTIATATNGASTIQVSGSIAKDKPLTNNFLFVVEQSTGNEYLFRYASRDTDTFTFPAGLPTGSTSAASATGTSLVDSTAQFQTDGVQVGDFVFNSTDGSWANVTAIVSETELTMKRLRGGTDNEWGNGDNYEIGILPKTFTTSDTVYVPYGMGVATGPSFLNSVQLVDPARPVLYIVRNSSPGAGSNAIKRFQQRATIGSIPASRNPETLATL